MGFSTLNQLSANPATQSPVKQFRLHGLMSSEISWMVPIIIISNAIYQDVLSYGYNLEVLVNVLKIFIKKLNAVLSILSQMRSTSAT